MIPAPLTIDVEAAGPKLDKHLSEAPNSAAVFLIHTAGREPYIARTTMLRRRLQRLLGKRSEPSRMLNLRSLATRVDYWPVGSQLESNLLFYHQARLYFKDRYLQLLKLRMPSYVKIVLSNPFPRTQVTTRLSGGEAFFFGPFRTRAAAELFESQALDLFQVRRCQEDLEPRPEHPGCIYGEMGMCLRPCQKVVGAEEYASEVRRLVDFLSSGGKSMLEAAASARDRLSEEMQFEEAARQHARYERIQNVLKLRDDLASELDQLHGVAVTRSSQNGHVDLWFLLKGVWHAPHRFRVSPPQEGKMVPMDRRLRDVVASLQAPKVSVLERQEHVALLARWYYSSWRDGDWIPFESLEKVPYRKLVRAISRIAGERIVAISESSVTSEEGRREQSEEPGGR
ncbi:MAG: hypothetical protein IRZ15_10265 [Bryobacteraceae bacterium]|nr:hypothetical protein [Bryobacteraceae bacterium]